MNANPKRSVVTPADQTAEDRESLKRHATLYREGYKS